MRLQCAPKTVPVTNNDQPFSARGIHVNTAGTVDITYDDGSTDSLTVVAGQTIFVAGGKLRVAATSTAALSAYADVGSA